MWTSKVQFPVESGIFPFASTSSTFLGPTQSCQMGTGGLFLQGLKLLEYEADHSPLTSVEAKNV
jgi:hypothetical protein